MARRKVKKRLQFKRLQKQHRIANPYKKQKDSTALHTQAAVQDEAQMIVENEDVTQVRGNSNAESLPPFAENQPATGRALLLRQAADKKRLQLIVKTLRSRRKKLKRANKEQKKQLSRRIKELTANVRNKHARELEETRLLDSAPTGEGPLTGGIPNPQDAGCETKAQTPSSAPTVAADEDSWIDVVPRKGRQKHGRARRAAKAAAKLAMRKSSYDEGRADDDINGMEVEDCSSDGGLEKVEDCEL